MQLLLLLLFAIYCRITVTSLHFKWTASIDRSTGIATSLETSIVPLKCNLCRAVSKTPSNTVESVFARYPTWLASWRVTFGLLRAIPIEDKRKSRQIAICDSVFGVKLLSFGTGRFRVARKAKSDKEYNMLIPIVGGLMALPSSKGSSGALSFSLIQCCEGSAALRLETAVTNDYRPTIAGEAPVSRLRASFYRSTQSLLHAYIMWRFHHYCYSQSQ